MPRYRLRSSRGARCRATSTPPSLDTPWSPVNAAIQGQMTVSHRGCSRRPAGPSGYNGGVANYTKTPALDHAIQIAGWGVSRRFPLTPHQKCLFAPELQWQPRGKYMAHLTGVRTGNVWGPRWRPACLTGSGATAGARTVRALTAAAARSAAPYQAKAAIQPVPAISQSSFQRISAQ
jgi:hypothetical protein